MSKKSITRKYSYIAKPGETIKDKEEVYKDIDTKLKLAGLVLLAFELVKKLVIKPIKAFYENTTFGPGLPFKTYESDVLSRDKYEFKACLLYLRDFMDAISSDDITIIMKLMEKRNAVAHELSGLFENFLFDEFYNTALEVKTVLFKISNYRIRMELGADPEFQHLSWEEVVGDEYILYEKVLETINMDRTKI